MDSLPEYQTRRLLDKENHLNYTHLDTFLKRFPELKRSLLYGYNEDVARLDYDAWKLRIHSYIPEADMPNSINLLQSLTRGMEYMLEAADKRSKLPKKFGYPNVKLLPTPPRMKR